MFPIAHGESPTNGDQKPRRDKLVFRYSSLDLGMHYWASTKLKLNFYLINLYVAFTWRKNTHFRILILEYDEANAPLQIKRSRFKKKHFKH